MSSIICCCQCYLLFVAYPTCTNLAWTGLYHVIFKLLILRYLQTGSVNRYFCKKNKWLFANWVNLQTQNKDSSHKPWSWVASHMNLCHHLFVYDTLTLSPLPPAHFFSYLTKGISKKNIHQNIKACSWLKGQSYTKESFYFYLGALILFFF